MTITLSCVWLGVHKQLDCPSSQLSTSCMMHTGWPIDIESSLSVYSWLYMTISLSLGSAICVSGLSSFAIVKAPFMIWLNSRIFSKHYSENLPHFSNYVNAFPTLRGQICSASGTHEFVNLVPISSGQSMTDCIVNLFQFVSHVGQRCW